MSERAWIRGAQRGSVADLERLFREHWPRAYRAALLVTGDAAAAEDIAQEAFLAAVRHLDRFDRRDRSLPGSIASSSTARSTGHAPAGSRRGRARHLRLRPAAPEPDGTCSAGSATSRPSTAPSSFSATCSSTRPGRSRSSSTCRAARSTRACGAAWTDEGAGGVNRPEERGLGDRPARLEERTPGQRNPGRASTRPAPRGACGTAAMVVGGGGPLAARARRCSSASAEAVGVEHAAPVLFSLPASGRLLVVSSGRGGVWVVDGDGQTAIRHLPGRRLVAARPLSGRVTNERSWPR